MCYRQALVRREDGVTIFWYACRVMELLEVFSHVVPERTVREVLDLHEYTSTRAIQAKDLASSGSQLQVVLDGNAVVGVKEPEKRADTFNFDLGDTFRSHETTIVPPAPGKPGAGEAAGATVR